MRRIAFACAGVLSFTFVSFLALGTSAQNADVIKQRQTIFKSMNEATKPVVAMFKGAPFDLVLVQKALKTYSEASAKLPALFPEDSKTGGDTEALPAIWENKADFDARLKKLGTDSASALLAIKDEASFKAIAPGVAQNCGGCHKLYRVKKEK